jgi:citrate synthase
MERKREPFHWRTAISYKTREKIIIRGYDCNDLIGNLDFGEAAFLVWKGELPTENEGKMMNAMLVSVCEHAFSPSSVTARFAMSGGVPINTAVAAGVSSMGWSHASAELPAKMYQEGVKRAKAEGKTIEEVADEIVRFHRENRLIIQGYHQPQHIKDPRAPVLIDLAWKWGIAGDHTRLATAIEDATEKYYGRRIYLNTPGAVGAICSDMGFHPDFAKGVMILARVVSLVAHSWEEAHRERAWRASTGAEIVQPLDLELQKPEFYDGPPDRPFPPERRRI